MDSKTWEQTESRRCSSLDEEGQSGVDTHRKKGREDKRSRNHACTHTKQYKQLMCRER